MSPRRQMPSVRMVVVAATAVVAAEGLLPEGSVFVTTGHSLQAAPPAAEGQAFSIGEDAFSLAAPEGWERVEPKSRIVETEFSIPSEEGLADGRMTVMGAGGSVAANIDRWFGQFVQPDGSPTKDHAVTKTVKVAGCTVTIVDVAGTFRDMPGGPFAGGKTVERPDYRMLAAIVETPSQGNYFLKFYGPGATVAKHADGFRSMIEGIVPAP